MPFTNFGYVSLYLSVLMILVHRYRLHLLLMFTYSIAFQMYVSNVFTLFVFGLERVHFSCDFLFQMCLFFWIFSYNFISDIFLFVFVALGIYVLFWMRKSTIKLKYFYYVVQSQACFSNSSVFSRIVRLTKSNAYKYRFYFELQACT